MTWHGTCALCGDPVTGGGDDGTLDLPVGSEAVVCLTCVCYGVERGEAEEAFDMAGIPLLVKRELAEAGRASGNGQ